MLPVCMYVCMYVCMNVCSGSLHVFMYVCSDSHVGEVAVDETATMEVDAEGNSLGDKLCLHESEPEHYYNCQNFKLNSSLSNDGLGECYIIYNNIT
jgi:hypothetical protein